ncbi:MAG: carboxymuconolactone decarboxylase family protein [Polyangiales bacterium]
MATMAKKSDVLREMETMFGRVPNWAKMLPDVTVEAVWTMMRDFQLAETKIPNKYKELIGLAVSGATRCRYCALFHTEAARLNGATEEEIAEASMMGGYTMMMSTFMNAQQVDYDQFAKETKDIIGFVKAQMMKSPEAKKARAHA